MTNTNKEEAVEDIGEGSGEDYEHLFQLTNRDIEWVIRTINGLGWTAPAIDWDQGIIHTEKGDVSFSVGVRKSDFVKLDLGQKGVLNISVEATKLNATDLRGHLRYILLSAAARV